jgi:LysR family nitrogen assimilation transcriptional regulator
MTVDLRQLSYFVAIADSGSISSAASKLGIAQPSLSEVVARLEKQIGVQLIVRTARGMQLTQAGVVLARHARDLLHRVDVALKEVNDLGEEPRGPVALGLPPTMALLLAVPLRSSQPARSLRKIRERTASAVARNGRAAECNFSGSARKRLHHSVARSRR